MEKVSIVEALADCLETVRQGSDLKAALAKYPRYRTQLEALLEVASLIQRLPESVAPSPILREIIRFRLLELREGPAPSPFDAGGEPSGAY